MMQTPLDPRMYLILREDLSYKYIQGGHALAQYALDHSEDFKEWNNSYLICLSTFNGLALNTIKDELTIKGITFSVFVEPDLMSQLPTAICLFDNGKNGYRDHLKTLNLATK